jgi:predicted dehydrogenase
MSPNTLWFKPHGAPAQYLRAGRGNPELCREASSRCRLPAGHPEGYLEAMANLYLDFARTLRASSPDNIPSSDVAGVPGIHAALRGMAFIEAMVHSNQTGQWQAVTV